MKALKTIFALSLCVLLLFAAGCAASGDENGGKPIVAVSIVPEETFVRAVCGDLAEVVTMIPAGFSPATYEPTALQMEKFHDASIYFSIGVPAETAYIIPNIGDVKVVSLADKAAAVYPERTFEGGGRDPHIWLSPKRAVIMVQAIADTMAELDPDNGEAYQSNAENYILQLNALDNEINASLENMNNKKIIVYHPAFGYLTDDYGLEMFALEQDGKEATAEHLQDMIDLAKAENIKVIFYQDEIDSSQSAAFAQELGGISVRLSPLSADYINNLKAMATAISEAME